MKRTVSLFLTLVMALCLLAAPASAESGKVKLTFSHWGSTTDAAVYQARVDLFNAQSDTIEVEVLYIPDDYATKVTTMLASGTAADVMVVAEETNAFAYRGQLLPLNDYLASAGIDLAAQVGQAGVNAYSYDGVTYGIADRAGCSVVYYNKDLFDAAGVGYPSIDWTRDDFLAAAKAIATEGDPADKVWGYVQEDWFPTG